MNIEIIQYYWDDVVGRWDFDISKYPMDDILSWWRYSNMNMIHKIKFNNKIYNTFPVNKLKKKLRRKLKVSSRTD